MLSGKYIGKFIIFFYIFFVYEIYSNNKDFLQKEKNVIINWTKGTLSIEYSQNFEQTPRQEQEKEAYKQAYFELIQNFLQIPFEGETPIKEIIAQNPFLQKNFHSIKDYIQTEKKNIYQNRIEYRLTLYFYEFLKRYFFIQPILEGDFSLPVKKEKEFNKVIIYVSQKDFSPTLIFHLYSTNGKRILSFLSKENLYFKKADFIVKNDQIKPYIVYANQIYQNHIVLPQEEIQFLLGIKLLHPDNILVVIYDEPE
ncbi:MAG: hypothetical protein NZ853_04410 [Leptospiraceae bacterium]|nr:hypothetical protein [Leptospiraceae bacterium]MDW7975417.1 hypothetical protein [Leptospiraceae bacterium]